MKTAWPPLDYNEWNPTYETLHRWLQIIGKLRLCKSPWVNHSWSTTLYVTSRGLTTSAIPLGERNLTVDVDFIDHKVVLQDSLGKQYSLELVSESVASFYGKFSKALENLDVTPSFSPYPNECNDYIAFKEDIIHETYDPEAANRCFQVLVRVNNLMQIFRSRFVGKCSPVHFFWGSFDLAVTRFSGRLAPEHPGQAPHISSLVMKEAYSHEVSSCGFWPGNDLFPEAAFYSYAYPMPEKFDEAAIIPKEAYFLKELGEFVLPYEVVRNSPDPEGLVLSFFQSTYEAAADLGSWDRERLEESPYLEHLQAKYGPIPGEDEEFPHRLS